LQIYRLMEYQQAGKDVPTSRSLSPDLLDKLRRGLTILFGLIVVANVALLGIRFISNLPRPTVVQTDPTPRNQLVERYDRMIKALEESGPRLRTTITSFNVQIDVQNEKPRCRELVDGRPPQTAVEAYDVAPIDVDTYPDLGRVGQLVDAASKEFTAMWNNYADLCGAADLAQVKQQVANQGGSQALVDRVDRLLANIRDARGRLQQAIDNPVPTRGPTAIPTAQPQAAITESPATGPTATEAVAIAPTNTPGGPTETPSPTPTDLPTLTPTPTRAPFNYSGLRLDGYEAFSYRLTVNYAGEAANREQYDGSLTLDVRRRNTPALTAEYLIALGERRDVVVSDLGLLSGPFIPRGGRNIIIKDGTVFTTGGGISGCQKAAVDGGALASLDKVGFEDRLVPAELGVDMNGLGLNYVGSDRNPNRPDQTVDVYRLERQFTNQDGVIYTYKFDVWLEAGTNILVRYKLDRTGEKPANQRANAITTLSIIYQLLATDAEVNTDTVAPNPVCN
jgi:hypothetical protein